MRDKQLLKKCLKFAKDLNIILESISDKVLTFVYKKLPEIKKEIIESSYKQITDNEQIKQLAYPYQSYILYKYLKEKTDINELYKICVNHITLFQRYRDRLKPEEQSIISEHLLKLPALEFKDELNQLANMIERERETKGKKKTAVFEKEEEKPYFEDQNVIIRDIKSREDAIKYGCDTRWCIAAPNNSMFSAYTLGGSQFVFYENKKTSNKFAFVSIHESNKELMSMCGLAGAHHGLQNNIIVFDKDDKSYIPEQIIEKDEFLPKYFNTIKSLLDKKSNGGLTEEFLKLYRNQKLIQNDQTRKYFSMSPLTSYAYFYLIDKCQPSPETYKGVLHSPDMAEKYIKYFPPFLPFTKNHEYLMEKNPTMLVEMLDDKSKFTTYKEKIPELIKHKAFSAEALSMAIRKKYDDIAELLIQAKCPMHSININSAIIRKNIKIAELLIQAKCPMHSDNIRCAIDENSVEFVTFLAQAGCPMNSDHLSQAIGRNNKEIVDSLIQAGCPMDNVHLNQAISWNREKIAELLIQSGCPIDKKNTLNDVLRKKVSLDIITALIRRGCSMDHRTLGLTLEYNASYDTISVLLQYGCPISAEDVHYAIKILGRDAKITKLLEIYYKKKKTVSFANVMRNFDKKSVQTKRKENEENFEDIMDTKKKYKLNENKNWEELWDNFIIRG